MQRTKLQDSFNDPKSSISVLVLSYQTSNEGLNLHRACWQSIMLEQGRTYSQEVQAWSRVRRIGQRQVQETTRLVNSETIDMQLESGIILKQDAANMALGIIRNAKESMSNDAAGSFDVHQILIGAAPKVVVADSG
jgi:hypothetical protein